MTITESTLIILKQVYMYIHVLFLTDRWTVHYTKVTNILRDLQNRANHDEISHYLLGLPCCLAMYQIVWLSSQVCFTLS